MKHAIKTKPLRTCLSCTCTLKAPIDLKKNIYIQDSPNMSWEHFQKFLLAVYSKARINIIWLSITEYVLKN